MLNVRKTGSEGQLKASPDHLSVSYKKLNVQHELLERMTFGFKSFQARVLFRVTMLSLTLALTIYLLEKTNLQFAVVLCGLVLLLQIAELFRYVSQTHVKLTRFLESIRYSDFTSAFAIDHKLGKSFKDLNMAFNEVMEAFRKARAEKEAHWQYLNTIVEQVRTGILSYDADGNIELINMNARRFLGVSQLKNISQLSAKNFLLFQEIRKAEAAGSALYKGSTELHLTIQAASLRIRGQHVKLITLQNIRPELQRQELDAWHNLTRVLRHEIMNSITPISSLTSTLREVLEDELYIHENHYAIKTEGVSDLKAGLATIENRSKALIKFIDAYREYTSLPQPVISTVLLKDLVDHVERLMRPELEKFNIKFSCCYDSEYLTVPADREMIEHVLINLIKNAIEAASEASVPAISVHVKYDAGGVKIEVTDNGSGIIEEALEHIFVPFYTTKKTGSGIGLSLSRQIMQLHKGTLTVISEPMVRTTFTLRF